jgi:hypothetical protein
MKDKRPTDTLVGKRAARGLIIYDLLNKVLGKKTRMMVDVHITENGGIFFDIDSDDRYPPCSFSIYVDDLQRLVNTAYALMESPKGR